MNNLENIWVNLKCFPAEKRVNKQDACKQNSWMYCTVYFIILAIRSWGLVTWHTKATDNYSYKLQSKLLKFPKWWWQNTAATCQMECYLIDIFQGIGYFRTKPWRRLQQHELLLQQLLLKVNGCHEIHKDHPKQFPHKLKKTSERTIFIHGCFGPLMT